MTLIHRRNNLAAGLARLVIVAALLATGIHLNPHAAAAAVLTLYHPIFDGNTIIYLQNPQPAAVSATAWVFLPVDGSAVTHLDLSIPSGGSYPIDQASFPGLAAGTYSLVITSGASLQSVALLEQPSGTGDNLGAYTGNRGSGSQLFGVFSSTAGGITSALELLNGAAAQEITLQFFTHDGMPKPLVPIFFSAYEEKTITGSMIGAGDGESGWIKASAANPISGVLVYAGNNLYRIEDPLEAVINGSAPRLFKGYTEGGGQRTSRLLMLNPEEMPVQVAVSFLDDAAVVQYPANPVTVDLPAHSLQYLDLEALAFLPAGKVYSARIAGGPVAISEETVFDTGTYPAGTVASPAQTGSSFQVPAVLRELARHSVVSVQNSGNQPAALTLAFVHADGTVGVSLPGTTFLSAGQALRIDAYAFAGLGTSFAGSLLVSSTSPQSFAFRVDQYKLFQTFLPVVLNRSVSCSNPQDYQSEPFYSLYQWDMDAIHAEDAWASCLRGNPDMVVAVIDSGVDLDHPELQANLLPGYDFIERDAVPEDGNGHGTHVAGTIAAAVNQKGIVGVAPNVKILPVRVLDNKGEGNISGLVEGIDYASTRAQVLNISIGGMTVDNTVPHTLKLALDRAIDSQKRLVIAAAGNYGNNGNKPNFPAAYTPVLAVAAVDNNIYFPHPGFSNTGNYIDISAPGVWIFSTYQGMGENFKDEPGYDFLDGTSMASPHVSGLAALVWSLHPEYSPDQVISAIENTALDLGFPGWDNTYGCGVIQVDSALGIAAPRSPSVSACAGTSHPSAQSEGTFHPAEENRSAKIVPGRVLVKLKEGSEISALTVQSVGLDGLRVEKVLVGIEVQVLSVPAGQEWQVVDRLRLLPDVVYAEPDYVVEMQ